MLSVSHCNKEVMKSSGLGLRAGVMGMSIYGGMFASEESDEISL